MKKDVIVCIGTVGRPTFSKCYKSVMELKKVDPRVKKVVVIRGKKSKAEWLNEMIRVSKGYTWCLQVDEDMYVNKDCISELINLARVRESQGVRILNASGMLLDLFLGHDVGSLKLWRIGHMSGLNFRDVIGSDRDIAIRAAKIGLKNVSTRKRLGIHDSAPNSNISFDKYSEYFRKMILFNKYESVENFFNIMKLRSKNGGIEKSAYDGIISEMKKINSSLDIISVAKGKKYNHKIELPEDSVNSRIKVSVIITNFNKKDALKKAVRSVLSQTYKNIDIIIVDDASSDKCSIENVYSLKEMSENIRVFVSSRNGGPYCARNFGIIKSYGEVVTFLDADDEMHESHIANNISVIEKGYPASISMYKRRTTEKGQYPVPKICEASIFFKKDEVIDKCGVYHNSRCGSDTEFRERVGLILGNDRIAIIPGETYFSKDSINSVTKSSDYGRGSKFRLRYAEGFRSFHSSAKKDSIISRDGTFCFSGVKSEMSNEEYEKFVKELR